MSTILIYHFTVEVAFKIESLSIEINLFQFSFLILKGKFGVNCYYVSSDLLFVTDSFESILRYTA